MTDSISEQPASIENGGIAIYTPDDLKRASFATGTPYLDRDPTYDSFGYPVITESIQQIKDLITKMDRGEPITDDELTTLLQHEKNVFKFHLQVPETAKYQTFNELVKVFRESNGKADGGLRDHKIQLWKMRTNPDPKGRLATFVFYPVTKRQGEWWESYDENEQTMKKTGIWLIEKISNMNLPAPDYIPRYSVPVIGKTSKGVEILKNLSMVQGSGFIKDWLIKSGKTDMLNEYYNEKNGYALSQDVSPIF